MKMITKLCAVLTIGAVLVGCANQAGELDKQSLLGLGGAIGGGVIGSNIGKGKGAIAGTIGGAILGGLLGSELGKSMNNADVAYQQKTQVRALERNRSGVASSWRNPDSGASGSVIPRAAFTNSDGRTCREFQQRITVGGKSETAVGTACRNYDGSWEIVN